MIEIIILCNSGNTLQCRELWPFTHLLKTNISYFSRNIFSSIYSLFYTQFIKVKVEKNVIRLLYD
jgi:hypothetical protein